MLVCTHCRTENSEDAPTCRSCGRALEATGSPMRRLDRPLDAEPQIDLPPPRAQSIWPVLVVVLAAGLGLLGWGLFAALRPNPCEGKYSSALFSYCADIPEGWAGGSRFNPDGNLDRYERLGSGATLAGGAQTTVEVSQVVDPTVATAQYAQQFRTSLEADGRALGPIEVVMLDGEQAIAWDHTVPPSEPDQQPVHVRDVIAVRPDGAWQIRFIATDDAYEEARVAFEDMLASWRWKP